MAIDCDYSLGSLIDFKLKWQLRLTEQYISACLLLSLLSGDRHFRGYGEAVRPSVRLSVCPSVRVQDNSRTDGPIDMGLVSNGRVGSKDLPY